MDTFEGVEKESGYLTVEEVKAMKAKAKAKEKAERKNRGKIRKWKRL